MRNRLNVPTLLTLARVMLIPLFWFCFSFDFTHHIDWAMSVFILACLTDWLDGFLARQLKQKTRFGAFLDPVADKLMVAVALVLLVGEYHQSAITWPAMMIIGREITVSALREWMAEWGEGEKMAVSRLAQWKTAFQMLSLSALLYGHSAHAFSPIVEIVGVYTLWLSALLTFGSMLQYLLIAWPKLQ